MLTTAVWVEITALLWKVMPTVERAPLPRRNAPGKTRLPDTVTLDEVILLATETTAALLGHDMVVEDPEMTIWDPKNPPATSMTCPPEAAVFVTVALPTMLKMDVVMELVEMNIFDAAAALRADDAVMRVVMDVAPPENRRLFPPLDVNEEAESTEIDTVAYNDDAPLK